MGKSAYFAPGGIRLFTVFLLLWCACSRTTSLPRNIILLIPDGCGISHMTLARWYKGSPLHQDSLDVGLIRTASANSVIAGSAAAATAFATGHRTWEEDGGHRCVGMTADSVCLPLPQRLPPEQHFRPLATILEAARESGRGTGFVATSTISHATPAGFSSHWHDRNGESAIIEQQVHGRFDVVFGGGWSLLMDSSLSFPTRDGGRGRRRDGDNLVEVLRSRGYAMVTSRDELLSIPDSVRRVWGIFNRGSMVRDIDRPHHGPSEPSLAEMTERAIRVLSGNRRGFVLMVEGSQVDWSSHDNDPVGVVGEYLAFDAAVGVALDFAKRDARTLVLVFSDHDNGGLSIGRRARSYTDLGVDRVAGPLRRATASAAAVEVMIRRATNRFRPDQDTIRSYLGRFCGIDDATNEEMTALVAAFGDTIVRSADGRVRTDSAGRPVTSERLINLREKIGHMVSSRAGLGWTTEGHTGSDVPVFAYGLGRSIRTIDNTGIAQICAGVLGVNLDSLTQRLFAPAREVFAGAQFSVDTTGVEWGGGLLRITRPGDPVRVIPFNRDVMIRGEDTVRLGGVAVYSVKTGTVFLSRSAGDP